MKLPITAARSALGLAGVLLCIEAGQTLASPPTAYAATALGACSITLDSHVAQPIPYVTTLPTTGGVRVSPGGGILYIGTYSGRWIPPGPPWGGGYEGTKVDVVESGTGRILSAIETGQGNSEFTVGSDGGRLYVGQTNASGKPGLVAYSLPRGDRLAAIDLSEAPIEVAASSDGKLIAAGGNKSIAYIDARTFTVLHTVSTDRAVRTLAFSPDASVLYAALDYGAPFDGDVLQARNREGALLWEMKTSTDLFRMAISSDGKQAYASSLFSKTILAIDLSLRQFRGTTYLPSRASGVALSPDDATLVAFSGGSMLSLDTATRAIVSSVEQCPGVGAMSSWSGNFIAPMTTALPLAVEFHHAGFDHYFVTDSTSEMDALDTGTTEGWTRTDQNFPVYVRPAANRVPVCRFFSTAFGARSSHFFAPRGFGCEQALTNPDWKYEGDAFFATLPDAAGSCANGGTPVYRLYNNGMGGAPNHRLTASLSVRAQMIAEGWIAEGAGIGVGMCGAP